MEDKSFFLMFVTGREDFRPSTELVEDSFESLGRGLIFKLGYQPYDIPDDRGLKYECLACF